MTDLWPVKMIENSIIWGRASGGTSTTLKDDAKNMETDLFKDKLIKIIIDEVQYIRKITANTADTFTFGAILAAAAAQAVIDNTAVGGGKVTITADPAGAYANPYTVKTIKGEGENAVTTAVFAAGVLLLTLGTGVGGRAGAVLGAQGVNSVVIQAKTAEPLEGYSIEMQISSGEDIPLGVGVNPDTGLITISLGTDDNGQPDDTKNTVGNIVNALNANIPFAALFTAMSNDGAGVHDAAISPVDIEGGAYPVVTATAADVKGAIDGLDDTPFTAEADTAGKIDVVESLIAFSGGVDEVKPVAKTEYFVM